MPTYPSSNAALANVYGAAVVGKISQDDSEVHKTSEDASAETSDGGRCDLSKIYGTNDRGLSNTESRNETSSIDETQASSVAHEHCHTDDPENAELTRSPDTTDAITNEEGSTDFY